MAKTSHGFSYEYTPEALYFATYMSVSDRRLFYTEWKRLSGIIDAENYGEEVRQKVIAVIRDMDDKIDFDELVSDISGKKVKEKETAICLAFEIAFSDGSLNDEEVVIFEQAALKWDIKKARLEEIKKYAAESTEALLLNADNSCFANEIFEQEKYKEVCGKMDVVAKADIDYSMAVVNNAVKQLKTYPAVIKRQVDNAIKATLAVQDSDQKKDMQSFLSQLMTTVSQVIDEADDSLLGLQKKQKDISGHYTVSFMGRTKAGKSTIHSILLGEINSDFIGKGMERTTRFNYIYDYNGIRIIDTPGIGAPNGQTDTEIAKEVADESDLICYVVTSDSIQETEFAFLEHLKEKNKPVIILLNKKENFARSTKTKEKFLEDPLHWYNKDGEDAIQGHIDRITEYVQKKFNYHNYTIIPVQLLAGKMACLEEDAELKEKLMRGSRINVFIDALFSMICEYGMIQKSQTIYNSSLYYLGKNADTFREQTDSLKEVKREFSKHGNRCAIQIEQLTKRTRNRIIATVNVQIDSFLANDVREFAYENFDLKKEDAEKEWKKFLVEKNIEKQIQSGYETVWQKYIESVEEIVKEEEENMEFSVEFGSLSEVDLGKVFNKKSALEATGKVIGLVGSLLAFTNPFIGGVIVAVSVMMSLAGGRKKPEERIKATQEKLYASLRSSMNIIRESILKDVLKQYDSVTAEINKNVKNSFEVIDKSMGKIEENIVLLQKEQQAHIEQLNRLYAARIANCITDSALYDLADAKSLESLVVDREYGKQITMTDDKLYISERPKDIAKVSGILQETIVIKGGE